ncbi:MAG: DNA repair protein RadC [Rickettsiales bacterium]|nr:DNA repair protein RadC [Rickettsiales bacterium]
MEKTSPAKNFLGHRKRVREKFLISLGKELSDYELLEILLFAANSRFDTKPLAKKLIAKFGNISKVINADIDNLRELKLSENAIVSLKVVVEVINRVLKKSAQSKNILDNWKAVLDYAYATLRNLNHETFRVLFLDKKHQLIKDELVNSGENDKIFISAKLIVKKALLLQAAAIILLHNHPSGDLRPSSADIKTTDEIIAALKNLGIKVFDHLIISDLAYFSFRENGLM